jgi:hypothetical protein
MARTANRMSAALLALLVIAVVLAVGASPAWAAGPPPGELAFFFSIALAGDPFTSRARSSWGPMRSRNTR